MAEEKSAGHRRSLNLLQRLIQSGPMPMYPEPDEVLPLRPVLERYAAASGIGSSSICIVGEPGAYFVQAAEQVPLGPFMEISQARAAMHAAYGDFITPTPPVR